MSVAEVQKSLQAASSRDKLFILAWLKHDLRAGSETRRQQLSSYQADIARGEKLSLAEFKALNRALDQAGL
jgi:hypothetical protein